MKIDKIVADAKRLGEAGNLGPIGAALLAAALLKLQRG